MYKSQKARVEVIRIITRVLRPPAWLHMTAPNYVNGEETEKKHKRFGLHHIFMDLWSLKIRNSVHMSRKQS